MQESSLRIVEKKVEQVMKDFDRDYWMDAKEALDYGIVDQVVEKI